MEILFIGCGKMGEAIVSGMLQSKFFNNEQISTILPQNSASAERIRKNCNIEVYFSLPKEKKFDVIIFAVKPQTLNTIIEEYKNLIQDSATLLISIAAGKTLNYFSSYFPNFSIIRVMPNINALVRSSVSIGSSSKNLTSTQKEIVEKIFSSIGSFKWVDENQIDNISSVTGCGPAYFYFFTECLFEIAKQFTKDEELAYQLAIETFIGSAYLLQSSKQSLSSLRESVTSKGGMTEKAISIFRENEALSTLLTKAIFAASEQAKALSS